MFPLTHLYVNRKVMGYMSPALALGSIFPDMLTGMGLSWKESHALKPAEHWPREIYLGDALHGVGLPGLDYYTDQHWNRGPGYAFQKAEKIAPMMAELGLPESDLVWRGHNQVEMAVEIQLGKNFRYLFHYLEAAYHDKNLLTQVENIVYEQYRLTKPSAPIIAHFIELNADPLKLSQQYAQRLNRYYGLQVTRINIEEIIQAVWTDIEKDYEFFLEQCIERLSSSPYLAAREEDQE